MDKNGNGSLDIDDFRWGFIDYGFQISKEEAEPFVKHFEKNGDGKISYEEFLQALKHNLNDYPARLAIVKAAWAKISNGSGFVGMEVIA